MLCVKYNLYNEASMYKDVVMENPPMLVPIHNHTNP